MSLELAPAGLRREVNNQPAEAEVEALPNGLEAFNESRWPGQADGNENQAQRSKRQTQRNQRQSQRNKIKIFCNKIKMQY